MNVTSYRAEYYLFSDIRTTHTLKTIEVLLKGVLIYLRARENFFACTLHAIHRALTGITKSLVVTLQCFCHRKVYKKWLTGLCPIID